MKYSEKWGDSVESAVELALQDLKLTKDQVKVTVLEEPTKGFFGIGSKLAKVRVEEIVTEKVKEVSEKASVKPTIGLVKNPENLIKEDGSEKESKNNSNKKAHKKNKSKDNKNKSLSNISENEIPEVTISENAAAPAELVSAKPADLEAVEEHPAKSFLADMFKEMGIEVSVSVAVNKDSVYVDVDGKDTGTVIGKRGQTLDAIQYLTSLVVNKGENEYIRVIVDAEGYRAKREATLEKLAQRLADKVVKTGKSTRLEPMNPYERKVIHTTLQNYEGVNTRSEGDEPYRRVVIEPKRK